MDIDEAFPSKYIRASDLAGDTPAVIDSIFMDDVGGNSNPADQKPVIMFRGMSKGVVLNKTNATTLKEAYGRKTDDWIGKQVVLYPTVTSFQGKNVPCIRLRVPGATSQTVSGAVGQAVVDVTADVPL